MLQVDLSTLSGTELRQLLDSTRSRGQAELSYRILQEMADRRAREERGGRRLFRGRRDAGPRPITLDLGDPLERRDEPDPLPHWEPLPDEDDEPALTLAPPEPEPPRAPPRLRSRKSPWVAAGFAVGIVVGAAVGVGVAEIVGGGPLRAEPAVPANVAAAAPAQLQIAAGPEPTAPVAPDAPADHPPEPVEPEPALAEPDGDAPSPDAADLAEPAAEPAPVLAEAERQPEPPAATGCEAEPTPADRMICATPRLKRLQGELRRAYAEALAAHEDRALLRQRQLAWRDTRSDVSDPERLARLYEQRIRKLNAATADALASR